MPKYHFLLSLTIFLSLFGCQDNAFSPQSFPVGEQTLRVTVQTYDEFNRPTISAGPILITLVGDDRIVRTSIPGGSSFCEFHGLPAKTYLLTAEKEGYYSYETGAGVWWNRGDWSPTLPLYHHPSPAMRIDSIEVNSTPSSNSFTIKLITAQIAPAAYNWSAVMFFSRSSAINPSNGTYDFEMQASGGGGTNIITGGYAMGYNFPVPQGTRLYVTARLMTAATRIMYDTTSHLSRYTNLEENTTVVSSFVVQ